MLRRCERRPSIDKAHVNLRLNRPTPQFAPVVWAMLCLFGLGVFAQKLLEFPAGSSGWQGGIFGIVLTVFAFVAIEGWWLASQREIDIDDHGITIRSWLERLLRKPGTRVQWSHMRSANLVFDAGRKLEITTTQERHLYWAAAWRPSVVADLLRIVESHGVSTRMDWVPGSLPPRR